MCEVDTIRQCKILTKDKHYPILGITLLDHRPLMRVVVMVGELPKVEVETGIDMIAMMIIVSKRIQVQEINSHVVLPAQLVAFNSQV